MEEDTTDRTLFVGGLLPRTTGIDLRDYFQQFGAVAEANVVEYRHGISRGFGFVTFVNPQDAATACQHRKHRIDGKKINCNLAAVPLQISQPSSRNREPRMHSGGAVPHPSSSPSVRSPNYPMYRPAPTYSQPSGSNQPATSNNPMHCPGSVPPVYQYGQHSGSNQSATSNNPMHCPGSVPRVYQYDQHSGSNQSATSNNTMHRLGSVSLAYPYGQASGSNEPVTSNNPLHGLGSVPPVYPYSQAFGRNEPGDRRRGSMLISRQRQNRR